MTDSNDAARIQAATELEQVVSPQTAAYILSKLPTVDWNQLATKDDLKNFATKDDLRVGFAEMRAEFTKELHSSIWISQGATAAVISAVVTLATIFG